MLKLATSEWWNIHFENTASSYFELKLKINILTLLNFFKICSYTSMNIFLWSQFCTAQVIKRKQKQVISVKMAEQGPPKVCPFIKAIKNLNISDFFSDLLKLTKWLQSLREHLFENNTWLSKNSNLCGILIYSSPTSHSLTP